MFLGVYGDVAIMDLLGEFGLLAALAKRGIGHPILDLDLSDAYRHILRLYDGEIAPSKLAAELMFRRTLLSRSIKPVAEKSQHPCLLLEWILLQNPHHRFDKAHPALPQQDYPGLALGDMVLSLIAQMGRVMHMCGIVTEFPGYTGELAHESWSDISRDSLSAGGCGSGHSPMGRSSGIIRQRTLSEK